MQAKSVSSSLCLQKVFKSAVDAEIAQPLVSIRQLFFYSLLSNSIKTNLVGNLVVMLENNMNVHSNAIHDQSTQAFCSYTSKTLFGCRDKTFLDFEFDSL